MKKILALILTGGVIALQGCAHGSANRRLDEKVVEEAEIKNSADVSAEARSAIDAAPGLSDDQRARLRVLGDSTREQLNNLKNQSLKLRAVLVEDLVSSNYDPNEVDLIKKRIKDVENKKVGLTFDAVDKANGILGRLAHANPHVLREFADGHGSRFN